MDRSTRIIRPPQEGDVWYVRLHAPACAACLDTATVLELTPETVLLRVHKDEFGMPEHDSRYEKQGVKFVELARTLPRAVESPPCPTSPSDPTAPPSEPKPQGRPPPNVLHLGHPPTRK